MHEDLLIFVSLVEIGSFTGTAKKYATSQPTISRRIQALEENLTAFNLKTGNTIKVNNNQNRILTNDALSTYQLVAKGAAIGGAWDDLFFEQLANKEYIKILPEYAFGEVPFYLIRHAGKTLPALDKFTAFIESCFK